MSLIRMMIEKGLKRGGVSLLTLIMLYSLVSCANTPVFETDIDLTDIERPGIVQTGTTDRYNDESIKFTDFIDATDIKETEKSETSKPPVQNEFDRFEHSDVYYAAKQRWGGIWNYKPTGAYDRQAFLQSAAPFASLYNAGVVYYNQNGEPRVYGVDDEFKNSRAIQTRVFIDESTEANDLYVITQSVNGRISDKQSNEDIAVYSTMIKYDNLPTSLSLSIREHAKDMRLNLLIQETDERINKGDLLGDDGKPATCEILAESIVNYDSISYMGFFNIDGENRQSTIEEGKSQINFIKNVGEDGTITVVYNDLDNIGDFYEYTFNVKETEGWDNCIVYNPVTGCITEEQRDSLTMEEIMETYDIPAGAVLNGCYAGSTPLRPSDAQKATAELKYTLTPIAVNSHGYNTKVNLYENGTIDYGDINDLTRAYVDKLNSELTK